MTETEQCGANENSAYKRALESFKHEQELYERERELLEEMEDDQLRWKMLMRRTGRL